MELWKNLWKSQKITEVADLWKSFQPVEKWLVFLSNYVQVKNYKALLSRGGEGAAGL